MDKTGNISNVFNNPSPSLILPLPLGGGGYRWEREIFLY